MISHDDVTAAAQLLQDCKTLLASDAYERVIQNELEERFAFALAAGRDVAKSTRRRAEWHQASHVLEELTVILQTKLAIAEATLKAWHEQPKGNQYI